MKHTITLIPGDGIGPEVASAMQEVVESAGIDVQWEIYEAGEVAYQKCGQHLPDDLLESIRRNRVAIKGPVTTPVGEGFASINVDSSKNV